MDIMPITMSSYFSNFVVVIWKQNFYSFPEKVSIKKRYA